MTNQIPHYINGKRVESDGGTAPVYNPATGVHAKDVPLAIPAEVDAVVDIARQAQIAWRATSLTRRADVFFRLRQLLVERKEDLAELVSEEHGKTVADAAGEVARGIENVEFAAGLSHLLKGDHSEQVSRSIDVHQLKQPVGVVGAITPFNFPVMVPLWMVASAIAFGNAVILKPSEKDPSASVLLAELFTEAGLPDGVLNVVHGDRGTVEAIIDNPDVAAISFVGSTPIASAVYRRASALGKRVQALGGAKNHMIVMPDADLDSAADAAVSAAYGSAGERCMAISVLVTVGEVADPLIEKIQARAAALTIGAGNDPRSEMGPLISREARERVARYLDGAAGEGARVVLDGRERAFAGDGYFIGVSLVDNVQPGMAVYEDEIFGPVLSVVRVDSFDDALALTNANRYGNGAAVFTRDGKTAREFEFAVEAGMIGINVPVPVPVGTYSFGGWKASLFGDSHIYGPESVHFYTRSKVVTTRWPEPSESQIDLGFPSNG